MQHAMTTTSGGGMMTAEQAASVRSALKSSLYPGASDASVDMVLSYCQAAGLDPMTKPVHIVPIWDRKSKSMRDVVMPGIGLYRTQASRSGQFAGISEPEFGPDVTDNVGGRRITYPQWCKVSVRRLLPNGSVAEFPAVERWLENYAQEGGPDKSTAPNAMWTRRPYGQLAKCAEAQALRKAFPEFGAQATAEEMDGAEFDGPAPAATVTAMPQRASATGAKPVATDPVIDVDPETGEIMDADQPAPRAQAQQSAGAELSAMPDSMRKLVLKKLADAGLTLDELAAANPGIGSDQSKAGPDANIAFGWIAQNAKG